MCLSSNEDDDKRMGYVLRSRVTTLPSYTVQICFQRPLSDFATSISVLPEYLNQVQNLTVADAVPLMFTYEEFLSEGLTTNLSDNSSSADTVVDRQANFSSSDIIRLAVYRILGYNRIDLAKINAIVGNDTSIVNWSDLLFYYELKAPKLVSLSHIRSFLGRRVF
jgi:hypothetical protein